MRMEDNFIMKSTSDLRENKEIFLFNDQIRWATTYHVDILIDFTFLADIVVSYNIDNLNCSQELDGLLAVYEFKFYWNIANWPKPVHRIVVSHTIPLWNRIDNAKSTSSIVGGHGLNASNELICINSFRTLKRMSRHINSNGVDSSGLVALRVK